MDNGQDKVGNVRGPRIHTIFKVADGGAAREVEVPFVIGVMGDLTMDTKKPKSRKLKDRRFIEIKEGLDKVMEQQEPGVKMTVKNTMVPDADDGDTAELDLHLTFSRMKDFEPEQLIQQIPELKRLYDMRQSLVALKSDVDGSEQLGDLMKEIMRPGHDGKDKMAILAEESEGLIRERIADLEKMLAEAAQRDRPALEERLAYFKNLATMLDGQAKS